MADRAAWILIGSTLLSRAACGAAQPPWRHWIEKPDPARARRLESLFDLRWRSSGGKEGKLSVAPDRGPWGGKYFKFRVRIDHHNAGKYPIGWPSFETQPKPPLDFRGYDAIAYWIRCDTNLRRNLLIRFILWTAGKGRMNTLIPPFPPGRWVQVVHRLDQVPHLDQVCRLHFFLCESDYSHGDEMTFKIGGFQLCRLKRELSKLKGDAAALAMWLGPQGDASERIPIVDAGAARLPALLLAETGPEAALRPDDELRVTFHDAFGGRDIVRAARLGSPAPPGKGTRIRTRLDVSGLAPGYYIAAADVRRRGRSLLAGRVGAADFYIRRPKESMTYSVLSIRAGMALWVRDLLYGDIIGWARAAPPHVYDPLDKSTYLDFIKLYATATWKHTEGNEAGDTGLALAAEAFRQSGDAARRRFAERLLDDSVNHMIQHMQAPSGGVRTTTNELARGGYDRNWAAGGWTYDSNQMGEWMRAITYAVFYYGEDPATRRRARELCAAVRKTADYLVAHAVRPSDGVPRVLRHLRLVERPDGSVEQHTYYQEGRQCDVYLGRALAGLSYYAYARCRLGLSVPDEWWKVMDDTVRWCEWKMKPNGWFDWQCGDVVEGGCHTYLGNIYVGEGLFGVYLAAKAAGRDASARAALRAAHKAYRYVTDDCWVHGRKFGPPTEFWVGPYVYWLFAEYLDAAGPEPKFEQWRAALDRRWRVERRWMDFLDRPRNPAGYVGRAASNGMLNLAVLGYLGLRRLEDLGKPLPWMRRPELPLTRYEKE